MHVTRPHPCPFAALLLAAPLALAPAPALAEAIPFGPSLGGAGWRTLTFRSLAPAAYAPEGRDRLGIRASSAASLIWREVDEGLWDRRRAEWRWRVQSGPPATNLARKGADDRAIALYFVFARDEASARAAKGATSLSSAMWWSSGQALVYVWGGSGAKGSIVDSPHMAANGKLVIRQPGGTGDGAWIREQADLAADFRRAFGREPGPLVGLAISSDSDDTGTVTVAGIEGLSLR